MSVAMDAAVTDMSESRVFLLGGSFKVARLGFREKAA